jgi:hypothetical protein
MMPIRDFISALAITGKSFKEIEETVKCVYGNKGTQIYNIIKKVKEGKLAAD